LNQQKAATEALKNTPLSPQLPSGVPAGHFEEGKADELFPDKQREELLLFCQ